MQKIFRLLCIVAVIVFSYQCKNSTTLTAGAKSGQSFSYTVIHDTTDFTGLPALQSFVFASADSGKYWLMFGGRTNGFHGFGNSDNFPVKKANQFIYVYNTQTHVLDSMSVALLPGVLKQQYMSTNMPARQVDSFLYVCGGYGFGQKVLGSSDPGFMTFSTLSRVHVKNMINAVLKHDPVLLAASVVYDTHSVVQSTGGEIFKMPDGNFYLILGHRFTGEYSSNNAKQVYLDSVHIFKVNETAGQFKIDTSSIKYISDNLPDSTTQFRRRDLVVAPYAFSGGTGYGIGIYGGVFTYSPGTPFNSGGNAFRYPIYISGSGPSDYLVDGSYIQQSNIYSAPNLAMFDAGSNSMYTTIFGGLGDIVRAGGDSAAFSKLILTINRNYTQNNTSSIYNDSIMPHYTGAEGVFIRFPGAPTFKNNNLDIIDYQQINPNGLQLMGYIYGGIYSDSTQWNNQPSPKLNRTSASNKVYKVYLHKN